MKHLALLVIASAILPAALKDNDLEFIAQTKLEQPRRAPLPVKPLRELLLRGRTSARRSSRWRSNGTPAGRAAGLSATANPGTFSLDTLTMVGTMHGFRTTDWSRHATARNVLPGAIANDGRITQLNHPPRPRREGRTCGYMERTPRSR
jgi:hypothetical protein